MKEKLKKIEPYMWTILSTAIVAALFIGKAVVGMITGIMKPQDWLSCAVWTVLLGFNVVLIIGTARNERERKRIYQELEDMSKSEKIIADFLAEGDSNDEKTETD